MATPTRESSRIREATAAAAEVEAVREGINKVVRAAAHDAVNGLIITRKACNKHLSALVSNKTFESSAKEAAKKVPVAKTQLKEAVKRERSVSLQNP